MNSVFLRTITRGLRLLSLYVLLLFIWSCTESPQPEFLSDSFEQQGEEWKEIKLKQTSDGSFKIGAGRMTISNNNASNYGVFNSKTIAGNFYVDAAFATDKNIGLALIKNNNGAPDLDNYTMLCVDKNEQDLVVIEVNDRQNAKDNVLDNTGLYQKTRSLDRPFQEADDYRHVLTGKQYSVPFKNSNGRIRIFRDGLAGFFHYYYAVKQEIHGKEVEGYRLC